VPVTPEPAAPYREPVFSLRRPGRSIIPRCVAHLLIRLLIVTSLPAHWQAAAALYPVSLIWPLIETPAQEATQTAAGASILTESAFGELLGHSGTDVQPYAFTGEPLDPNSGWQYHRARWMDPRVGRFSASDFFAGSGQSPKSLHKYLHANGNPVDYTDATGLIADMGIAALSGMMSMMTKDSGDSILISPASVRGRPAVPSKGRRREDAPCGRAWDRGHGARHGAFSLCVPRRRRPVQAPVFCFRPSAVWF
jgi:RHS repeat-associated protein